MAQQQQQILAKVDFQGDIRRFRFNIDNGPTQIAFHRELIATVWDSYGVPPDGGSGYIIQYRDEEGDWCRLTPSTVDDALQVARETQKESDIPLLKLKLVPTPTASTDEETTPAAATAAAAGGGGGGGSGHVMVDEGVSTRDETTGGDTGANPPQVASMLSSMLNTPHMLSSLLLTPLFENMVTQNSQLFDTMGVFWVPMIGSPLQILAAQLDGYQTASREIAETLPHLAQLINGERWDFGTFLAHLLPALHTLPEPTAREILETFAAEISTAVQNANMREIGGEAFKRLSHPPTTSSASASASASVSVAVPMAAGQQNGDGDGEGERDEYDDLYVDRATEEEETATAQQQDVAKLHPAPEEPEPAPRSFFEPFQRQHIPDAAVGGDLPPYGGRPGVQYAQPEGSNKGGSEEEEIEQEDEIEHFRGATFNDANMTNTNPHASLWGTFPAPAMQNDNIDSNNNSEMQMDGGFSGRTNDITSSTPSQQQPPPFYPSISPPTHHDHHQPTAAAAAAAAAVPAPAPVVVDGEMEKKLSVLREMGFPDRNHNILVLQAYGGDLRAAVLFMTERVTGGAGDE